MSGFKPTFNKPSPPPEIRAKKTAPTGNGDHHLALAATAETNNRRPNARGSRAVTPAGGSGIQQPGPSTGGRPGVPAGPARNLGGRPLKKCGDPACEACDRPRCLQCKGCLGKRQCVQRRCAKLQQLQKNNRKKNPKQCCSRCMETFSSPSNCAKHIKRGSCGYYSEKYNNYIHVCECGTVSLSRSAHNQHILRKRNERKEAEEKADPQQPPLADPQQHLRFKMQCKVVNCEELRTLRLMARHERGHDLHHAAAEEEAADGEVAAI